MKLKQRQIISNNPDAKRQPTNQNTTNCPKSAKVGAKVLWLQLDISNNKAREIVEANNIFYIENKCTKIEFEKFLKK